MKRLTISIVGLALAGSALAQQVMQARNPKDQTLCMTASLGSIYWQKCQDGNTQQQIPVSIITLPATPAPVPSAPAPAPSAPTDPKTHPAEVPSAGTVPLFSDRHPSAAYKAGNGNPHHGPYPFKNVLDVVCLNNIWGASGSLASGWQSLGARDDGTGGVDLRAVWSYPGLPANAQRSEVTTYPSCVYGQTPSGSPGSPGKGLPKRVGDIKKAEYSYKASEGSATRGQHVSDIWITRSLNCRAAGCRAIEIMWLDRSYGGYNVPCAGCKGSAGRSAANLGTGPNPKATVTRTTIGGRLVDVFDYEPGTWGGGHRLVKLIPVELAQMGAARVDVLGILSFLKSKGRMTDNDYVGAIEVGWEPVADRGATSGDVTMRGLRIEVQ
jgi:hypothetical protein